MMFAPAFVGLVGGVLCYLLLRSLFTARLCSRRALVAAWPPKRLLFVLLTLVLALSGLNLSFLGGWEEEV